MSELNEASTKKSGQTITSLNLNKLKQYFSFLPIDLLFLDVFRYLFFFKNLSLAPPSQLERPKNLYTSIHLCVASLQGGYAMFKLPPMVPNLEDGTKLVGGYAMEFGHLEGVPHPTLHILHP